MDVQVQGTPQYYQELQQQQQPRNYDDPDADEEAEMEAERDLAEDAQWKRIQQNTFTRWANEHLKIINQTIANLESDLSDGLRLIALIEVLSQKRMSKHNKRPTFRSQKLENVSVALKFLEVEGIKIVNIDSSDIVDCKLKLIMGLIWTLILHYSISLPMWEGDENGDNLANGNGASPKQRLMNWIHRLVPDLPINNFTSDWTNGKAVGALVDAVAPGLCPDWPMWDPKDAVQNAAEAMGLADDWLNVRQLIRPEEMVNPNIDEQSMMTYLSQYPNAKLKSGAPLRPRTNHSSVPPPRVRAYGPGIEPTGPTVGAPANFTVETFSAGKGNVDVAVHNPNGNPEKVDCRFNNDKNLTYSVSYIPKLEGPHKVYVKFNGRDIPKSPYEVQVESQAGDASKVTASGPGLLPDGVVVGKQTYFDITTKDAGKGTPEVIILDPANHKTSVAAKLRQLGTDQWRCEYTAKQVGLHSVNVFFCGQQIRGSPYGVRVAPVCDSRKVRASGRGLQPVGVRVNDDDVTFRIFTEGAGEGVPEVKIFGPGGVVPEHNIRKLDATTYEAQYIPLKEGRYKILVLYGGQEIPKSPFEVTVGPQKHTSIVAYGPGLKSGMVGQPACFVVETNGETGNLGFSIAGPSQAEIECHDNGDGSALVKYHPTAPGEYAVHILCDNEDIPKSPHIAQVLPKADDFHPELVKVTGPGVEKNGGVIVGKPTEFTVDATRAGSAPLEVKINDVFSNTIAHKITQTESGTKKISYTAPTAEPVTVEVNYGGVAVPQSPFRVNVSTPLDASKVQFFGPWLEPGVKPNAATHFNVDARAAGNGLLEVNLIHEESKQKVSVRIIDNNDNTYAVEVIPPLAGTYSTNLLYGGLKVPLSPKVTVSPPVDVSKIKVDGLEPTAPLNSLQQFRVITNGIGKADLAVTITSPSGNRVKAHVIPTAEGFLVNFTPTQLGEYLLSVSFGGTPITPQPFRLQCLVGSDSRKVQATGPGLVRGIINRPAEFMIDTRGAGQGGLGVTVEGPCEAAINCRDNGDGTCNVAYLPTEIGDYTINITFNDDHIAGSPYQAIIVPEPNLNKIRVSGMGIQPHGVVMNSPTDFLVDMSKVGDDVDRSKLSCNIFDPRGNEIPSKLVPSDSADDVFRIMYTPFEAGRHTIELLYDNVPVPGSPFVVNVKSGCDPSRCRAYGPGLEGALTDKMATFTVETRGAGAGGLSLAIEGPSEAKMSCTDNRDGSCDVEYLPTEPGEYDVTIRFAEKHIPGSPFRVVVNESTRPEKVKVYGPGIEHGQVYDGIPAQFFIDCGAAGPGKIAVKLSSSEGKPITAQVQDKGEGVYGVTYVPPKEGSSITANVRFADQDVSCSPFVMIVSPAPNDAPVKVYGDATTKKSLPASLPAKFQIDAPKAKAKEDINVSIKGPDGKPLVPKMEQEPDGTYAVSFVPDECGPYNVSIKCGGKDVLGSPFLLQAIPTGEADKCKMVQAVPVNQEYGKKNHFAVDAREAGTGAVTCKIVSHSEASDVDIDIIEKDGFFDIFYVLKDPGDYDLDIKFGGQNIPNGTFTIKAVDNVEEQITKSATSSSKTTSSATSENHSYQHQESYIEQVSSVSKSKQYIQQTASEEFLVRERLVNGKHDSVSTLNSVQQLSTTTTSSSATNGNGTTEHDNRPNGTTQSANRFHDFKLDRLNIPQTGGPVTAEVKMPSGQVDKPFIDDNHDGTVSIRYEPKEEGIHELAVKYNGEHVQGSPFKFHVDSISSGYVTAYGPGLVHGVTGEPAQFIISTKGAGAGGLQMAVEGPSKADITYHDNKDGTVSVSYLPTAPGEYKISVRFGDKHIKGSPYFAKITGEGRKRNQISVGSCSEVTLPGVISDNDLRSLNASIQAPSGLEEPCFLKRMPTGNIGISFTPREIGEHTVSVKRLGKHIANSPFKVNVCEREVGDAKKVLVTGNALKEGKTHQDNVFSIDTRNAGYGGLSLSIEGPSKAEIQCTDKDDGTLNIAYKPTEPGYYIVNLKFADHHVTGSPFTVKVSGEGTNRQREKIQRQREAVPITEVGSQCKLTFKMPGITSFDLSATVTSPGGVSEDAEIQEIEDGLYAVHFIPKELGVHTVSVKYKQIHIPGSPFQFTVGPLKDTGAHLVKAGGPGLEHGEQGVASEFNVWTREAGGGTLAISVEGPSKAEIEFKDRKDGSCDVSYVVSEPGDYRIGLKFNDRHIPDSPFKVYVSPAMGEAHKLEVAQFPTGCVQADKPAQFMVRKNGAKGELDAKVVAPSNNEDDCFIQLIDQDQYSVRFYPRENGIHAIHVKFNGVHIPGSPYRIKVGKDDVDPAAVHASGKGLGDVKTGEKTDLIIDTCNAGAGTLAVTVDGPAKVAMDCTEVEEGYKVRYTPLLPGHYYMTIKYNQMHIVGSPFKINCTGESLAEAGGQETSSVIVETVAKVSKGGNRTGVILPIFKSDASKIQSKGMGLKKAYMGKQNQFTVNAGDAGNNILFVGIYGPKGPCDEVFIKHTGRNQYTVNYLVRERGDYILLVKWGDDHIPGSPFKVEV
ncbi:filamin-A isoform X3 [Anopheles funestus]|uniref:filamin-A isoform X3 n=1 Tax=Anopheles funestus TaxID=62324 RepID=UPI0020C6C748|nr:filamin-A isoform X3 [Anopheles funestus]XP_049277160.1 filamin-A isoform X3 [Anopheles funestus]XP_049277161.1 filamin-A isoform X3 [Anopheles funestus]XP_049277162.1 filamin-A isoform X3 [Anopheles funestus]XP_049277163.1 filamin-A isoform X3 [Anopheles funestus]XP_049277164.1 filamin-A isoform X3 [Anopheles funestus]XP_049277166.1 filamin-A isoform X3 [Anopheles funestus]